MYLLLYEICHRPGEKSVDRTSIMVFFMQVCLLLKYCLRLASSTSCYSVVSYSKYGHDLSKSFLIRLSYVSVWLL